MPLPTPPCRKGITTDTLADLRDNLLPTAEATHLRAHFADCPACQQRMAEFAATQRTLRAQATPDLHAWVWRGVAAHIASPPQRRRLAARWVGGLGSVALVLLVALLFVQITGLAHGHATTTAATSTATTAPSTPAPGTATPALPTPLTPQQAWGTSSAGTFTYDDAQFTVMDVLPDATGVVGYVPPDYTKRIPAIIELRTLAGAVESLYTIPTVNEIPNVVTDGRYVAWITPTNYTGGPGPMPHQYVGAINLQTRQVTIIYAGASLPYDPGLIAIDHGTLFLETLNSIVMVDLATGTQRPVATIAGTIQFFVSWPYVLYASSDSTMHLKNVNTGSVTALPDVKADATISGTTVYYVQREETQNLQVFVLDHADQADAQPHVLLEEPNDPANYILLAANSRLLSLILYDQVNAPPIYHIWDLTQQRLIALPVAISSTALTIVPTLRGSAVAYATQTGTRAQITLWNTNTLPSQPVAP